MKLSIKFKKDLLKFVKSIFLLSFIVCFCISIGGLLYQLGLDTTNNIGMFLISGAVFLIIFAFTITILSYILIGILDFISYAIEKD